MIGHLFSWLVGLTKLADRELGAFNLMQRESCKSEFVMAPLAVIELSTLSFMGF